MFRDSADTRPSAENNLPGHTLAAIQGDASGIGFHP